MIGPEEVRRLAALARLEVGEADARALAAELASILEHLETLREAGVEEPEPIPEDSEPSPLRPDRIEFDPLRLPLDRFAPEWRDGFFLVPRVPGLGS